MFGGVEWLHQLSDREDIEYEEWDVVDERGEYKDHEGTLGLR